jgi:hypothetical protein
MFCPVPSVWGRLRMAWMQAARFCMGQPNSELVMFRQSHDVQDACEPGQGACKAAGCVGTFRLQQAEADALSEVRGDWPCLPARLQLFTHAAVAGRIQATS